MGYDVGDDVGQVGTGNAGSHSLSATLFTALAAHLGAGRFAEAEGLARRALALEPAHGGLLQVLGIARGTRGDHDGAICWLYRALCSGAMDAAGMLAVALQNWGNQFREGRTARLDQILDRCRTALVLDPAAPQAPGNLGVALSGVGMAEVALTWLDRAARLAPADPTIGHALVSASAYCPGLSPRRVFAIRRNFAERHGPPAGNIPVFTNPADPERPLRLAYLSGDLHRHPVARNLEPLLAGRDRNRFSVQLYDTNPVADTMSARLRMLSDGWHDVAGADDAEIAARMRADGIDILIVLAGHLDRNRPLVAAYRAAPVQISLFDTGTSGLPAMDYILTDATMTPRRGRERFTERPLRLPTLYAYGTLAAAAQPGPAPLLTNGFPTFASFNNPAKLNDGVLDLWGRILAGHPMARMLFKYIDAFGSVGLRGRIEERLSRHGVERGRLHFVEQSTDHCHHLAWIDSVDIALDPFPFSGATTTFECLWMGVPVVTLAGDGMMSRWSASLLKAVGLPHLAAVDEAGYCRIAETLVSDPQALATCRAGLRGRLAASPICDALRKSRSLERALRAVWRRWCASR